ncbi:MAG: metallophosphoesterase [Roseiarcus sp.]
MSTSFTIAHLSDVHLGPAPWPAFREMRLKRVMGYLNWKRARERLNDMAMLARLVADLRAQSPDHVAMTGDVANIGLAAEFRRAAGWMAALGEPADVSFTPGNHDAYVRDAMEPLAETFAPWTSSDMGTDGHDRFPFLRVRGDVALIGLNSGAPTAPLLATGRLGARQIVALGDLLQETGARGLARVILIHHPPLSRGDSPLRGLTDARALETIVGRFGAEAMLHGHTHRRAVRHLPSSASRVEGGRIPILGVPSAVAVSPDLGQRASYHLIRLERADEFWRVGVRARGMLPGRAEIGEREAPAI